MQSLNYKCFVNTLSDIKKLPWGCDMGQPSTLNFSLSENFLEKASFALKFREPGWFEVQISIKKYEGF